MKPFALLAGILLVVIVVVGVLTQSDDLIENPGPNATTTPVAIETVVDERLAGTELTLPSMRGTTIELERGISTAERTRFEGSFESREDSAIRAFASIVLDAETPVVDAGIDEAGVRWVLIPFVVNYGGSGTFVYVGLFSVGTETLLHHDSLLIDDRVPLSGIEAHGDGIYTAQYRTRHGGQGMAAQPTTPASVRFAQRGEMLIEVFRLVNATTDDISLDQPSSGAAVSSPISLSGTARGPWFFEANAPVAVLSDIGEVVGSSFITAEGEWMSESFVPFSGEVTVSSYTGPATLVLSKQNASGLPERAASLQIPITIGE